MPARPVVLVVYDPRWAAAFEVERSSILVALDGLEPAVEHIGSTAVPGLAAKPVVDVLVGLASTADLAASVPLLAATGLEYVAAYESQMPERRYFRRGTPERRTHHVHVVVRGGDFFRRHVAFRDWLRSHPDDAAAYGRLKSDLARRFAADRDRYQAGKAEFIAHLEGRACRPPPRAE